MKILVFGSLNIDHDYHLHHIAAPKETIVADSYEVVAGGKGLNASIALAKTGQHVWLAGMLGAGSEMLEDVLHKYNVDASLLKKTDVAAGHAIIQIDDQGENSIFIYPGSNAAITEDYIDEVLSQFDEGDYIVMQNEINLQDVIIRKAHDKCMVIFMNPSPFNEKLDSQPLELVNYFFINEVEGAAFTGITDPHEILNAMAGKFPGAHIILTLGSEGACYYDGKELCFQAARQVKAIDTVGAGDTFMGYFIYGMSQGLRPEECLSVATAASSITVQRHGAADAIPTLQEVMEVL